MICSGCFRFLFSRGCYYHNIFVPRVSQNINVHNSINGCLKQPYTALFRNYHILSSYKLRSCLQIFIGNRPFILLVSIHSSSVYTKRFVKEVLKKILTFRKSANATLQIAKSSGIKRLLIQADSQKWKILGAVGLLLISSTVSMLVPFSMGKIIDIIYSTSGNDILLKNLSTFCVALVIIFIIGGLANFGRVYYIQTSGQHIVKKLREELFSSIMKQDISFFDKKKTGELINRLSADTSLVGQSLTNNLSDGMRSLVQAAAGIGMMVFVSAQLSLFSLIVVPPVAAMAVVYGRYIRRITRTAQDSLAVASQFGEEKISNIRTVRAFAHEDMECRSYDRCIEDILNISYKESLAKGIFFGLTGLSGNLIVLSVFYFGSTMITDVQITVGELTSFLLYAAYVGISIGGFSSFYSEFNRALGASQRLWELIDSVPSIPISASGDVGSTVSPRAHHVISGDIEFSNVHFSYPARPDFPVLCGLQFLAPAGQVTAVVGPSGSGKSTVCGLLLRYYDPCKGEVMLDNCDITALAPSYLRSHIGTVNQDPVLFSCSIAENIAYGAIDPASVGFKEIEEAARKANAYDFISSFSSRFDTVVGERGVLLSGGQRQRIAIARAILRNPNILLLDEATSALDAESEYLVQDALERLLPGRTVLTVAHRLSTIKCADRIVVIAGGKAVETGSYHDLINLSDGFFRKLVERQTLSL